MLGNFFKIWIRVRIQWERYQRSSLRVTISIFGLFGLRWNWVDITFRRTHNHVRGSISLSSLRFQQVFLNCHYTNLRSCSFITRFSANESTGARIGSPSGADKENSAEVADASLKVNFNGYEGPTPTGRPSRRRQKVPANVPFTPKRRKIIVPVSYGMSLDAIDPNELPRLRGG